LDAGKITNVSFDKNSGEVQIELDKANEFTPNAYLRVKSFGSSDFESKMNNFHKNNRGQYEIPLKNEPQEIDLN
jgi:hypothetical protein